MRWEFNKNEVKDFPFNMCIKGKVQLNLDEVSVVAQAKLLLTMKISCTGFTRLEAFGRLLKFKMYE